MDTKDFILYSVFGILLAIAIVIYLKKKASAKKSIEEADQALLEGNDSLALMHLVGALSDANETPDLELGILDKIEKLYRKHQIQYDLSSYRELVENSRILLRKASKKSEKEFMEVEELKQKIREALPSIKEGDVLDHVRKAAKEFADKIAKQ
jgi:uncharacterized membrane protein